MRRIKSKMKGTIGRSGSPNVQRTVKSILVTALELAKDAGSGVPGAPMIFGGILSIIQGLDKSAENSAALTELQKHVLSLRSIFQSVDASNLSPELDSDIKHLIKDLEDCLQQLEAITSNGRFQRFVEHSYDEKDINSLSESIRSSLLFFQASSALRRELQENLRVEISSFLSALPRVASANYDSARSNPYSTCFEGTRVDVLREIEEWALSADPNTPHVFWLNGLAGIGKSTIAQTVSQRAQEKGILGGSFFFSRMEQDRGDSRRVLPTIAYQLALHDDTFKLNLGAVLRLNPDASAKVLQTQMERLIIEPMSHVRRQSPVLIVLDALDECEERGAKELLQLLLVRAREIPFPLRILITSRPEPHIRSVFDRTNNYSKIVLHDIESPVVFDDITHYVRRSLALIPASLDLDLPQEWAKESDVRSLLQDAGKLFVYAATAIRFIGDDGMRDPLGQLKILLRPQRETKLIGAYYSLDDLYTQVLSSALQRSKNPAILKRYQDVVGAIIQLRDPLPMSSLSRLTSYEENHIRNALYHLHSVIIVPPPGVDDAPSIYHPSLHDFITDATRCTDTDIRIEPISHDKQLALSCLKHLAGFLHRDMVNVQDPTLLNEDIEALNDRVHRIFLPETAYACRHWPSHVVTLPSRDPEVFRLLEDFASRYMLCWLEAMSILDSVSLAVTGLDRLQRWLKNLDAGGGLHGSFYDAYRLVLAHAEFIRSGPLQVYNSALQFAPRSSFIWQVYHDEVHGFQILQGAPQYWSRCLSVIHGHSLNVESVAYSPDGLRLVSGSDDKTLRLWDAASGSPIAVLNGHASAVKSVVFSPDGSRLASGSFDGTVQIWDPASGRASASFGYGGGVLCVALSSDGLSVACGLIQAHKPKRLNRPYHERETVCVWNIVSGVPISGWPSHTSSVGSIAFSPDAKILAFGTFDATLWLWDAETRLPRMELVGHTDRVDSVVFSLDGARLISGSHDRTIRIWDVMSGSLITTVVDHPVPITCVAISRDGLWLASSSYDGPTIRLWDLLSGSSVAITDENSPSPGVTSLAFFPDGSRLASTPQDFANSIRLWDTTFSSPLFPPTPSPERTLNVQALQFSSDGSRLASGARDSTIQVWLTASGAPTMLLKSDTDAITSMAFSPDGRWLVSGTYDAKVLLWDLASSVLIAEREELG